MVTFHTVLRWTGGYVRDDDASASAHIAPEGREKLRMSLYRVSDMEFLCYLNDFRAVLVINFTLLQAFHSASMNHLSLYSRTQRFTNNSVPVCFTYSHNSQRLLTSVWVYNRSGKKRGGGKYKIVNGKNCVEQTDKETKCRCEGNFGVFLSVWNGYIWLRVRKNWLITVKTVINHIKRGVSGLA